MQMVNKKVQAENGAQALTAEDFSALNSVEMSLERVMLNKARANSVTTPSTPMDRDVLPDVRSFRQLPLEHKNRSPSKRRSRKLTKTNQPTNQTNKPNKHQELFQASQNETAVLERQLSGQIATVPNEEIVRYLSREFTVTGHIAAADARRNMGVLADFALGAVKMKRLAKGTKASLAEKRKSEVAVVPEDGEEGLTDAVSRLSIRGDHGRQCRDVLAKHVSWDDFDIFELERLAGGKGEALRMLSWHVLVDVWDIPNRVAGLLNCHSRLWKYLGEVAKGYEDTPYHNALHAADIVQSVHWMLTPTKLGGAGLSELLEPLEIFVILFAAIVHDLGHDGKNNLYHINSMSQRAIDHNDISVHESEHCARAFRIMHGGDGSCNFIGDMNDQDRKKVRTLVIELILGTDMTKHFLHLDEFKELTEANGPLYDEDGALNDKPWRSCKQIVLRQILHVCDISNPCKVWERSHKWGCHCVDEFWDQGDVEKAEGLPVSPMCDRETTEFAMCQLGFINFIVKPTFTAVSAFLPRIRDVQLAHVDRNIAKYEELGAAQAAAPSSL